MKKRALAILLVVMLSLALFTFQAQASGGIDYSALRFDPDKPPAATLTTQGVTYNVYREFYCLDPVPGLAEAIFMLTIRIPVSYNSYVFTEEELANAPLFYTNPWGGDNGGSAPAATTPASGFALTALQKGFVTVDVGMRGKSNSVSGGSVGKLPNPIADMKASLRYLHFNDDVMPGNANRIIVTGWSSGGCATTMLGTSGNTNLYDAELAAIGAYMGPDARDDIWLGAPGVAVTMRPNGDTGIAYALFGDLTDAVVGVDTSELNKFLSMEYVKYLEEMNLYAEYDVPDAGIARGDLLTAANYRDYLVPRIEQSLLYHLNVLGLANPGNRAAIETYLDSAKNTVTRSSIFTPVWYDDILVDIKLSSWDDFYRYNSNITGNAAAAGSYADPLRTWTYQYDAPAFNTNVLTIDGVLPSGAGSPSTQSFGKPTDNGAIYTPAGIAWATANKGVDMSQEYQDLLEFQRNSVDPMYFLLEKEKGNTSIGDITIAPYWIHRGGSADFVNVIPNFFAFDTKLNNMGYNADSMLTWDHGHMNIQDTIGLWNYIAWAIFDEDHTIIATDVSASIEKLSGNKNSLTIVVNDYLFNGEVVTYDLTVLISNNAAGTYTVGPYSVYVDTKGNDQIRACYII